MKENKLNILIATGIYPPDIGGPATHLAQFLPFLRNQGVSIEVVSFGSVDSVKKTEEFGIPVFTVPRKGSLINRFRFYYKELKNKAEKADLMYVHDMSLVGLIALLISRKFQLPYLVRIGGDFIWEQAFEKGKTKLSYLEFQGKEPLALKPRRFIAKKILKNAQAIIVPSSFLRDVVLKWRIDSNKIYVIPNSVEVKTFDDVQSDITNQISDLKNSGQKVVVSSGRFVNWKNFDLLIEAISKIDDTHLFLIGDGPEKENLFKLVKNLDAESKIHLFNSVSRPELFKIISLADCFALLSVGDTFSFVSLEALHTGTPVVLARKGGLAEIFESFEGKGITFVKGLEISSLLETFKDISTLSKPGPEIRESLKNHFKTEDHFALVYGIMRQILNRNDRRNL